MRRLLPAPVSLAAQRSAQAAGLEPDAAEKSDTGHELSWFAWVSLQVAAACLYMWCRQNQKMLMLIDFSDQLTVNIYELGAVFLQLLKLLHLSEHPTFTVPIDPSLYLGRFAEQLELGDKKQVR